ncbi:MAG: sulfatase-like hydrolase/transferase [Candidatus Eisenbacteria bacterium]|nr:sulfatase-like hydrolase/transferase [Candidatus Eisenbacteria bacterium]
MKEITTSEQAERAGSIDWASGPAVGALIGLVEFAFHAIRGAPLLSAALLPGVTLLYVLYWTAAGFVVAAALAVLRRVGTGFPRDRRTGPAILLAAAVAFGVLGALLAHVFVDIRRPWTTLLNLAVLAAIPPLAVLFRRFLPVGLFRRPARLPLFAAAVVLLTLPLRWMPEERSSGAPRPAEGGRAPNILLFVFDTLRFDHVGSYGYDRETTPRLDRIAAEGAVFERAYAPSSWTLPSTASILTSRYPSGHGVTHRAAALPGTVTTLPALLRGKGYRTGLFSGNPFIEPSFGFGNGFDIAVAPSKPLYLKIFYLPYYLKRTAGRLPGCADTDRWVTRYESFWRPGITEEIVPADLLASRLLRWIDDGGDHPFFAHVQFMEPHDPYVGEGRFGPVGISLAPHVGIAPVHPFDTAPRPGGDGVAVMVGRYDDDIHRADRALGAVMDGLEKRGLGEDTWIVVTSDHGEEFWDHDGWGHGNSLFEELVRVPLLFRGRGIAPGRSTAMARLVDLAPTLAAAAGAESPPEFVGVSLLPVLLGLESDTGVRESFAEVARGHGRTLRSILLEDGSKFVEARVGDRRSRMLFDLFADGEERANLLDADSPAADPWLRLLNDAAERAARGGVEAERATVDAVTEERLRALGYVD